MVPIEGASVTESIEATETSVGKLDFRKAIVGDIRHRAAHDPRQSHSDSNTVDAGLENGRLSRILCGA
jgi:hypothetical protein